MFSITEDVLAGLRAMQLTLGQQYVVASLKPSSQKTAHLARVNTSTAENRFHTANFPEQFFKNNIAIRNSFGNKLGQIDIHYLT